MKVQIRPEINENGVCYVVYYKWLCFWMVDKYMDGIDHYSYTYHSTFANALKEVREKFGTSCEIVGYRP